MIKRFRKRFLASESLFKQSLGSLLEHGTVLWILLLLVLVPLLSVWLIPDVAYTIIQNYWYQLTLLTIVLWMVILACRTLTDIFSLRKKEANITWCQIVILITIGVWIIGFGIISDFKSHPRYATALGILGTILVWIFQDTIKGVAAFIHLRMNHLLCIGDWIQVPKSKVDGVVTRVSLTNVTIYNWDTTTSSIPTSALYSDYFVNLQKMREGKTYGRRMYMSFVFDTEWFHVISEDEANALRQSEAITSYLPKEEIKAGMLNSKLFRLYLFHWLMNHPHVSQQPQLIVRWKEPVESGIPLQLYVFITDSTLSAFEWQQSQIIEHIMKSIQWFGLRLYQLPSCYDAFNDSLQLTRTANNPQKLEL